jgi:endoglucanase
MKQIYLTNLFIAAFSLFSNAQLSTNIRLNQLGFYTNGPKMAAVIGSTATTFTIKNEARTTTVFTGTLGTASTWTASNESVKIADFSTFTSPGKYVLEVPSLGYSYPFSVEDRIFIPVNKALIKAYYFNRSSTSLEATHAGVYARAAGHPDNQVIVLPSAASTQRPAGTVISSPKGWYDAGDYNSYIVNSGISTYTLLSAYEHFEKYYDTLHLNIPESNNNMPDILDEVKWNLDWMLTMQDPNDGGVYTKKTNANFDAMNRMPAQATSARYVVQKSTAAAHDFAATMAVAYRIYKNFDLPFANTCLEAAKKAYTWASANPNITFTNPTAQNGYPAVVTGGYGDSNLGDELEWASNELFIATGEASYYTNGFKNANTYGIPDWASVRTLGLISLLHHRKTLKSPALADTTNMKNKLIQLANTFTTYQKNTSPYKVVMGNGGNSDFIWGSNSRAANQAMLLMNAYFLNGNLDYARAAISQVDYLLGRNATGYCFVTGFGSRRVMNIHHRPSAADGIVDPVPGWVAGGPTNASGDGCTNNATYRAISYEDGEGCYTKNEVTINWNAPAVYITGALEFLKIFHTPPVVTSAYDEAMFETNSFTLYPNPSHAITTMDINSSETTNATLNMMDLMGNSCMRKEVRLQKGGNAFPIDLSSLKSGVYVVEVQTTTKTFQQKLIVENK